MTLALNSSGMYFLETSTLEMIRQFGFADIYKWGGSSTKFSLIMWDEDSESTFELTVRTSQGHAIAGLILSYINAILEAREAEEEED